MVKKIFVQLSSPFFSLICPLFLLMVKIIMKRVRILTVRHFVFQVAMAGDYILAVTSMMIARLNHNDVTITLSQVNGNFVTAISCIKS